MESSFYTPPDPPAYVTRPPVESVVFAWGANEDGQLGFEQAEASVFTPHVVEALLGSRLRGRQQGRRPLVAGSRMPLAIAGDGQVWSWGWNERGSLGRGSKDKKLKPGQLQDLKRVKVVQVAAGGWHALAMTEAGQVYAWGGNEYGQCGADEELRDIVSPIPCVQSLRVRQVACGGMHSLALTMEGDVYCWGERWGEFSLKLDRSPKRVEGATNITLIACGAFHNLALNNEGHVLAWGTNDYGQLGIGSTTYRTSPEKVVDLHGIHICSISAGGWHSMALSQDGAVYVWGRGEYGRLGLGDSSSRLRPHRVPGLENYYIVQASAGGTHSAVLTDTGRILIWGRGSFGRLGDGLGKNKLTPSEVVLPGGANRWHVIAVACGGRHTCCLAFPLSPESDPDRLSICDEDTNRNLDQVFLRTHDQVSDWNDCFKPKLNRDDNKEKGVDTGNEENWPLSREQELEDRKDMIVDVAHSAVEVLPPLQGALPDFGDCISREQYSMSKDEPEGVRTCEHR